MSDGESLTLDEQLRFATRLDFLGMRARLNKPDMRTPEAPQFFQFSPDELHQYIVSNPGMAENLLQRSYDQRVDESAYMMEEEEGDGFEVGLFTYGVGRREQKHYSSIEDAATDFVLAFWKLPRTYTTSLRS